MSARDFLILERFPNGHRANYARSISSILDAPFAIGFSRQTLVQAITTRHLIITTFESAPSIYLALLTLRAIAGRRSTVILTRSHVRSDRVSLSSVLKPVGLGLMKRLSAVQRLSITPPPVGADDGATYIEDIEFWDLSEAALQADVKTALSERAVEVAAERPIILVTGTLEQSKGLIFLAEILRAAPDLRDRYAIISAGAVPAAQRPALAQIAGLSDLWEDRYLEDEEIFSLYRVSTAVWCCYLPSYDVSSGVFGRAVQYARPTIVRAGSIIDRLQDRLSDGLKLDYGDPIGAATKLKTWQPIAGMPTSRFEERAAHLRTLVRTHAADGWEKR